MRAVLFLLSFSYSSSSASSSLVRFATAAVSVQQHTGGFIQLPNRYVRLFSSCRSSCSPLRAFVSVLPLSCLASALHDGSCDGCGFSGSTTASRKSRSQRSTGRSPRGVGLRGVREKIPCQFAMRILFLSQPSLALSRPVLGLSWPRASSLRQARQSRSRTPPSFKNLIARIDRAMGFWLLFKGPLKCFFFSYPPRGPLHSPRSSGGLGSVVRVQLLSLFPPPSLSQWRLVRRGEKRKAPLPSSRGSEAMVLVTSRTQLATLLRCLCPPASSSEGTLCMCARVGRGSRVRSSPAMPCQNQGPLPSTERVCLIRPRCQVARLMIYGVQAFLSLLVLHALCLAHSAQPGSLPDRNPQCACPEARSVCFACCTGFS